jgi:hypothetical protein
MKVGSGRQGDGETGRWGDEEKDLSLLFYSPRLPVPLSPRLPVSPSPRPPVSPFPTPDFFVSEINLVFHT